MAIVLTETACFTDHSARKQGDLATNTPERRAIVFLANEVARWPRENGCFSCHNNGDAARALYLAKQSGFAVPDGALESTTEWVIHPERWDKNRGEPGFSDKCLARVQFASTALIVAQSDSTRSEAFRTEAALRGNPDERDEILKGQNQFSEDVLFTSGEGDSPDRSKSRRRILVEAATLVAECQSRDGAWRVTGSELIGSPVTYGDVLLTYMATRTLRAAWQSSAVKASLSESVPGWSDPARGLATRIQRAEHWLKTRPIQTILDSAAILLALESGQDPDSRKQKEKALSLIRAGQSDNGGWGPYVTAPPEVFDTAMVMLALNPLGRSGEWRSRLARARRYLIEQQEVDGGWPETTRPSGGESYAQRLSTSGWATMALIETRAFDVID